MGRLERLVLLAFVALVAGGCAASAPGWIQRDAGRYSQVIGLPPVATDGSMSLEQAIAQRRSGRSFLPDALPLSVIGQLLWAGQGITSSDGKRAAPSAGGLYPLELYVVTPEELMHYLPEGQRAEVRSQPDVRRQLQNAAFGQASVGEAPAIVVVAAVPGRTSSKYGARAETFVALEAGHAAENILFEATAQGLAAVPVGSFDPARVSATLALPPDEVPLYLIPVGHAP